MKNGDFTMNNWDLERTSGLLRLDRKDAWQEKISEFEVNRISGVQELHNAVSSSKSGTVDERTNFRLMFAKETKTCSPYIQVNQVGQAMQSFRWDQFPFTVASKKNLDAANN